MFLLMLSGSASESQILLRNDLFETGAPLSSLTSSFHN